MSTPDPHASDRPPLNGLRRVSVGRKLLMAAASILIFGCSLPTSCSNERTEHVPESALEFTWSQNPVLLDPGETKTVNFTAEYRYHVDGGLPASFVLHPLVGGPFTVSPSEITAQFPGSVGGGTFTSAFVVTANADAPRDASGYLNVSYIDHNRTSESEINLRVKPAQEAGTHSIEANPTQISTPNNMVSEQFITFTVKSVNGYTGPIKVTYTTADFVSASPSDNDIIVNVSPTTDATFNRSFYRYGYGTDERTPCVVRFTALNEATGDAKFVDVTINHSD